MSDAPIRPQRHPSMDSFGKKDKKDLPGAQPNASFGALKPVEKDGNKLESIAKETLDDVLSADAKTQGRVMGSDVSINSLQQKDGEWWW